MKIQSGKIEGTGSGCRGQSSIKFVCFCLFLFLVLFLVLFDCLFWTGISDSEIAFRVSKAAIFKKIRYFFKILL